MPPQSHLYGQPAAALFSIILVFFAPAPSVTGADGRLCRQFVRCLDGVRVDVGRRACLHVSGAV